MKKLLLSMAISLAFSMNAAYANCETGTMEQCQWTVYEKVCELQEALNVMGNHESFVDPIIKGSNGLLLGRFNHKLLEQVLLDGIYLDNLYHFDIDRHSKLKILMGLLLFVEGQLNAWNIEHENILMAEALIHFSKEAHAIYKATSSLKRIGSSAG